MSSAVTECSKSDPSTCRLHGVKATEKADFYNDLKNEQERQQDEFKQQAEADFEASWKVKTVKGVSTVSVFRSGMPSAPPSRGVERGSYERCDQFLPEGRQGRMTGVFCAPTLGGVARWFRGNYNSNVRDVDVREIQVDIDRTYVYSVHDWEKASGSERDSDYQKYWANGMTLRNYMTAAKADPKTFHPEEWELLVPESGIVNVKAVSSNRVLKTAYNFKDDIVRISKLIAKEKRFNR